MMRPPPWWKAVVGGIAAAALVLASGGCFDFEEKPVEEPEPSAMPSEIELEVPPSGEKGRLVAAQSGCLACHRFGTDGNQGPGPNLTHVGARLSPAQITNALIDSPGIMPSYGNLPSQRLEALVAFLAELR